MAIASANAKVLVTLEEVKKNPRRTYSSLKPYQKCKIGKQVVEHGVTPSKQFYKKKYPHLVLKERTVRTLKNSYKDCIKAQTSVTFETGNAEAVVRELPNKNVDRLLMSGDKMDKEVQHYITELRKRECTVNTTVAIAVGEGILLNKDANLLAANGGGINLTKECAKYLFR